MKYIFRNLLIIVILVLLPVLGLISWKLFWILLFIWIVFLIIGIVLMAIRKHMKDEEKKQLLHEAKQIHSETIED